MNVPAQPYNSLKIANLLDATAFCLIVVLTFVIPLAFNPTNNESLETTKFYLFIFGTALLIILWSAKSIVAKKVQLNLSFLQLPLLIFVAAVFVSALFSVNRFYSFFGQTDVWHLSFFEVLAAFIFLFITATVVKTQKQLQIILTGFVLSVTTINLVEIFSKLNLLKGLGISGDLILNGSSFSLWLFSIIALILVFSFIKERLYGPQSLGKTVSIASFSLVGLINLFTFIFLSSAFLPANPLSAPIDLKLDSQSSWAIATSTLQALPFFGSGPGTFSFDFSRFKPTSLNLTPVWNIRFYKSSNELLTLLPTLGLIGTLAFFLFGLMLTKTIIKEYWSSRTKKDHWVLDLALLLILFSLIFVNFSLSTFFVFFLFFSLWLADKNISNQNHLAASRFLSFAAIRDYLGGRFGASENKEGDQIELMPFVFGFLGIILSLTAFFVFGKMYLAQNYYQQGIQAVANGKNSEAINLLVQAANLNPSLDLYRVNLSQLYLVKAQELAGQKTLTEKDSSLLQNNLSQAITQIKLATEQLNPLSAANWTIRARTYQDLAGTLPADAKTDDSNIQNQIQTLNLAFNAYQQAILLDPANPQLKLDLGGMFFAQRSFADAEKFFTESINLKPNLPNAYYNLAYALKNQDKSQEAVNALQNTLLLLPKDSSDYQKIKTELEDLQKLITPSPTPTPAPVKKP